MLSAVSIPEEKVNVTYRLIKVYTLDVGEENYSPHAYDVKDKTVIDKSHTQLFYNVTNKTELSKCTPSYTRVVNRPNKKVGNLYWFDEALKSVPPSSSKSEPTTLWEIDPVKIKKSKVFRKVKRPRAFVIHSAELGCHSVFEYGGSETEPKGYSGEITTPFDDSSVQRYRWVRYKDGSRWVFIARNDPDTPLVELRKTNLESEFEIVFLKSPPPGWRLGDMMTQNKNNFQNPTQFTGRYPSVFSNPSTYRSSATSGFLTNRESSFSDLSDTSNGSGGRISTMSGFSNIKKDGRISTMSGLSNTKRDSTFNFASIGNLAKVDSDRYWQEYVLATTVTIQDEVNSHKRRLWK